MNVALVHDYLLHLGGAERVLKALAEIFPKAPIYTILYDEKKCGSIFPKEKVTTSNLQKLPRLIRNNHKYLLPLIPRAVEEWDFSKFDLVISSNNAFTHGIITKAETRHICYFHSPMRFAWDWTHEYIKEQKAGRLKSAVIAHLLKKIRIWNQASVDRVDLFLANSKTVQNRITKYYRRDSTVIYPPVDISRFKIGKTSEDYFLIISNLTPYKRIDLAIQLFNKIRRRLVIIGDGPQKNFLQNIAGDTIDFLGFKDDETTAEYLTHCRALIFPGEDDFGITPVEAFACGKPVLAFGRGGAKETVIEGVTGEFFNEPTIASMEDGLARLMLNEKNYSPLKCRRRANEFSKEIFVEQIRKIVRKSGS
ncbi:glycosyltransferase [Candidatus Peregrinibacteria bacterium]|nr:glycosyltransferase [Candidatus Peregrinibacteria bacterium]